MRLIKLPDFKIRLLLSVIFYLFVSVALIQLVNFFGVMFRGLDFLSWWPMGQAKLFGIGGLPEPTLSTWVLGLGIQLRIPGLDNYLEVRH